jgi:arginyl-tRNA synthetase
LFATSDKVITDATSSSSSAAAAALSAVATSSSNSYDATSMELIDQELRRALRKAYPSDDNIHSSSTNMMLFQGKSEFGDYQCNIAMPLSKVLKQKPRDIAETIMSNVAVDADGARSIIEKMDISGPGFINIHLSSYYIKQSLYRMLQPIELLNTHDVSSSSSPSRTDEEVMTKVKHQSYMYSSRVGVPLVTRPQRIVVDFSSPNIAKEMHVVR